MPTVPIGGAKVYFGSDFLGANASAAVLDSSIQAFGVGTETYTLTVDESGGILALGTGATDDNNAVLRSGPFAPRDGLMVVQARFKYDVLTCGIWVGFTETLDATTPVMPSEFATASMTYGGTGGMVGFCYDSDGTTDDFRALMGDAGAAISDSGNGVRANATLTVDQWFEAKVVVFPDGSAECFLGDAGHVDGGSIEKPRLIKSFKTGTLLTPTDLFFACLMIETRTAAAKVLEVDYFGGFGGRDWRYS